jgi:photosystem II stability/assembly factor-like uncharacterized protein
MDHRSQELFHSALLNAFPSWDDLDRMVAFHFDQNLSEIAARTNLGEAVFDLIQWAEARDELTGLIRAALRANSENIQLVALAQNLGIVGQRVLGQWSQCSGPYGGGIMALTVDPHDSRVLYAGTAHSNENDDWIYKSVDGGGNWKVLRNGLPGYQIYAIAVGFHDSRVVYAGTGHGLYKSTDGGASWQMESERNACLEVRSVALSPQDPDWVALGSIEESGGGTSAGASLSVRSDSEIILGKSADPSSGGYHWSKDGGSTWLTSPIKNVSQAVFSPQDNSMIYIGTAEKGVFRSLDGGDTWENIGRFGLAVFCLAVSPRNSQHVVVGTERGLFVSFDSGRSWMQSQEIGSAEVSGVAFSPADDNLICSGTSRGVFESLDGGRSWKAAISGLAPLVALPVAWADEETVYVGTDGGGCYKKRLHEVSWQAASSGLFSMPITSIAVQSDIKIYAGAVGIHASANGGNTWRSVSPPRRIEVWALAVTPAVYHSPASRIDTGSFHISRDRGQSWETASQQGAARAYFIGTNSGEFLKSTDGGLTWESINLADGNAIYTLIIAPQDDRTIYAATLGKGVFKSIDGGISWQTANTGLGDLFTGPIVSASPDGRVLYCGTGAHGVFMSSNSGETWQNCGPWSSGKLVESLAVFPGKEFVIYAGTQGAGICKSSDGGASWQEKNTGLNNLFVRNIVISSKDPNLLFAGTRDGLYISRDGGDAWQAFQDGLDPHPHIYRLEQSPSGKVLYATMQEGVFHIDLE